MWPLSGIVNGIRKVKQHNPSKCGTDNPFPSSCTSAATPHPSLPGDQKKEDAGPDNSQLKRHTIINFDDEIKTLEDALWRFGLYDFLERLDISLEKLRKCRITDNEHEECCKEIDKEIVKLALLYHPDTVMRRKGTENEIKRAHHLQTTLNCVRKVLSYLNSAFLADIHTDHKFQFYLKMNITSMCDENEVKCHVYEMKFRLFTISRIKQQNIILQIRKFLIESKKCIGYYIEGEEDEFKKSCCSVLFHLNQCIESLEKLYVELEEMEKQYKMQKYEKMLLFVQNMKMDIVRDLQLLELLEKSAKLSMNGKFQFFSTDKFIDPYFVRPLVWYTNVTIMCYSMANNFSSWKKARTTDFLSRNKTRVNNILQRNKAHVKISRPKFEKFWELRPLFFLTAYYCGDKRYRYEVKKVMHMKYNRFFFNKTHKPMIIQTFRDIVNDISRNFGNKLNEDLYAEIRTQDNFSLELEKFMSMRDEFEKKKQDLSESMGEFWTKTAKIEKQNDDIVKISKNLDTWKTWNVEEMAKANSQITAVIEEKISKNLDSKVEEMAEANSQITAVIEEKISKNLDSKIEEMAEANSQITAVIEEKIPKNLDSKVEEMAEANSGITAVIEEKISKNLDSKVEEIAEANSQITAVIEENKRIIQELLKARENSE